MRATPTLARAVTVACIGLGPVLVVAALRLPLVNQLDYADPWFYSAYAWVPKHHFDVVGWNYFAARFPAILSIGAFERVFGTDAGYLLLRYVLAVASGAALYLCVRRFATVGIALATTLLLYLDPFFSRMLLWDYSVFVAVSAGVVGFALWWWSDGRPLAWTLLPGAALAIAVFATAVVGTALVVLFAIEAIAALRLGKTSVTRLAARLGISAAAALGTFVVGYLGYLAIIGSFSPDDLLRPTINYIRSNAENSGPYQHPPPQWLLHELRIWPPVVVSLALLAVLRRRVLGTEVPARIAQACIAYTAFLWVFRFTVTSSVIETWWAYDLVVVVMAPALGVLLHELSGDWRKYRLGAFLPVALVASAALAIRSVTGVSAELYQAIARHPAALFAVLGTALAAAALLALGHRLLRISAFTLVLATLTLMMWAPSILDGRGTTGIFVTNGKAEWRAYDAARSFANLVRDYDSPGRRVYTWYPGTIGLTNIGWVTLPQQGTTVQELQVDGAMDQLLPLGRSRLLQPTVGYVLVMSTRSRDLSAARSALSENGFSERSIRRGSWAGGRLRYLLLSLTGKPRA